MNDRIGKAELVKMFAGAAESLRSHHQLLSQLDSIAGDGDHGTTMLRVAEQLEHAANVGASTSLQAFLRDTGWSILGVDGGASSALIGTFFMGMAHSEISNDSISCQEVVEIFAAGLSAVAKQTKAQPGDKTMMDALVPAVKALGASAESIAEAFTNAASAAQSGAASTRNLTSKYGRAKFLGEKTKGHPDAGATSIALVFLGFSKGLSR